MKKIAIVGTHGTGKTTLAYKICAEAKEKGMNATIINEVARSCPFPLNESSSLDGCIWMVSEQIKREMDAIAQKTDIIVCDRSVLDMIAYVPYEAAYGEIYEYLKMFCMKWFKTYDNVFWVHPTGETIEPDGIRATDVEFQKKIHISFQHTLSYLLGLKSVKTVRSSSIFKDQVKGVIAEALKKEERIGDLQ